MNELTFFYTSLFKNLESALSIKDYLLTDLKTKQPNLKLNNWIPLHNDFFNSIIEDDLTFITITPHIKRYEDNLYLTDNNEVISDIDYHFTTGLEHGSNTIRRIHYSQRWLDLLGISDYQRLKPTLKEIPDIEECPDGYYYRASI